MKGFIVAAPASGSGKTTVTLGLLRALRNLGVEIAPAKAGPDYIDPAYHTVASGVPCINLDPWAMRPDLISALASRHTEGGKMLVVEGMMGLFDGARNGRGSAADLATHLSLPVILVLDCARQSHSIAAVVSGFRDFRRNVMIAGLILNRVGSARHEAMLRSALEPVGIPVLGSLPRDERLRLPERHLGLVQAGEHADLDNFVTYAGSVIGERIDLKRIQQIAGRYGSSESMANISRVPPLGQRIAVARDNAFAFSYLHLLDGWRRRGAEISFFSPLADEAPAEGSDAIYLPGGYPELHGEQLARATHFAEGIKQAAARGALVYGECGGYMVLGESIEDAAENTHRMLGLLPLETSFAKRKLHLGYRVIEPLEASPFNRPLTAHEFHYASIVREGNAAKLFRVRDALGEDLGEAGLRVGSVCGSYMHVIDLAG
ncbi:cobyrinic acid a,c-diamide synthase [Phyllobacterium brassicacearum]|uniref:Hydrogenobyrinate a,c-diamide synthase n=1 Tax=Phyllobacterium brassicacearum TaxID=314235 RepID=A0A2P7BTJ9_9HYPH|nr:cobyrinate a,c-diamide synthase [Phyllobacterium brassicacearum]PSH69804.1 cobyrinic acid a,c-diamide synthase [Phyllobacterium brassicacearum]TDQ34961.1 hydrogenobyrinic acid a,c-diamide synthase (glutamine-hydrolysing) /cobyrinate a,c-diamide synthase [Phyllobacterium brassicacearum]